jgi:hypothetical protein
MPTPKELQAMYDDLTEMKDKIDHWTTVLADYVDTTNTDELSGEGTSDTQDTQDNTDTSGSLNSTSSSTKKSPKVAAIILALKKRKGNEKY